MPDSYSDRFQALWVEEIDNNQFEQKIVERTVDMLPEGDLLIEVQYSSLNYKDALSAHGNRGVTKQYPHTPGADAAGIVIEDRSGRFKAGDSVLVCGYDLGMNTDGGLAQRIRIPAVWASSAPETLTLKEAMIYGSAGFTAALCIDKLKYMGATPVDGDIAVTGATGGVGSFTIALLNKLGYSVVALTGKLKCSEMLYQLGAGQVVDRETLIELGSRPLASPQWAHGVDCVGGDYLFNLIKSIKYGGSVTACGLTASPNFSANVYPFILRGVNLLGIDCVELPIEVKQQTWEKLAGEYKLANLESMAEEITLDKVPDYLKRIYNGQAIGRYVVKL